MLELKTDEIGRLLPIKNKSISRVCTPQELVFFFRHCFAPNERKFKMILLAQLGCECRVGEAVAINLDDFHKGTNYRELDMLIQKKAKRVTLKDGTKKVSGSNVIEHKIIPEAIAAHLRAWIKYKWKWIQECEGYIFPSYVDKNSHISSRVVQSWLCRKRKQLARLFPDRSFGNTIGMRRYKKYEGRQYKEVTEPLYLWSSHMMKRFAGTYMYLFTKDLVFTQQLLSHESTDVTQKHYVDGATISKDRERIKNALFDINFYDKIKDENEKVAAVWNTIKKQ